MISTWLVALVAFLHALIAAVEMLLWRNKRVYSRR